MTKKQWALIAFKRAMIAEFHKYDYLPWKVVTKWASQPFEEILIILFLFEQQYYGLHTDSGVSKCFGLFRRARLFLFYILLSL